MSDAIHIQKAVNAGHIEIAQQTNNIYDTDGKKDSCLKDLYVTDPVADKLRIEDDKGGLLKDCYSWILENDDFKQWRDDPNYRLLWIKGDPGKGKTMLLAGLITELEKTSDDSIFYFFCQAAQPLLRTASYVLRGLIWSIVRKRPALISYVRKEYDQAGRGVFRNHNAWQAASRILTGMLEDEASTDYIIVIDALDECTEGREKLISYISQSSVDIKAKWVISSRNWPEIESQLDATQRQVRLRLELNQDSISNAVVKFVNTKIDRLNSTYDGPNRERIRKHLLANAKDTFLWVALVCQELETPGVQHYHSADILNLKRFPPGLDELYERMINDINDRDMQWCRAILAVVAVALRPLSLQELAAADGSLTRWVGDKETLSSLVIACGSLLTIREDTVYTVHQSVNDFLRSTPKILHSGIAQQQFSIFLSSIKVMQDMLHRNLYELRDDCTLIDDIPVLPRAPLTIAGYACIYWVDHLCEWPLTDDQDQNNLYYAMITQLLESKYLYWLEAMSLLRRTSEAIKAMQRLEDKFKDRIFDDLRLLVQDAVRFASTHRTIMDAAPLQLYDSALIFTPQFSKIKGCFIQEINKSIDVFSPDFQHWDARLHTIPGIASDDYYLAMCEYSPDGQQIAAINSRHDSILLFDASTGGLVKSIEFPGGELHGLTFHPSGDSIVTLSGDKIGGRELAIFHLPNGEYTRFSRIKGYSKPGTLLFSPDGQLLALGRYYGTPEIWDTTYGTILAEYLTGGARYIFWIDVISHPHALLTVGTGEISIWSLRKGYGISRLMTLSSNVNPYAAAISSDRTCCAVWQGGIGLVLYSWGSSIHTQQITEVDRDKGVYCVSWVVDGRLIALCGTFGIELWDLEEKRLVARVTGDYTHTICYANRQLASCGHRDGTLKIWSLDAILSNSEHITQQSSSICEAFIRTSSGKVAVISHNAQFDMLNMVVKGRFYQFPKTLPNSPPGLLYRTESLALGHGDYFAVATNGGAIDVFNLEHDTGLYYCERRIGEHVVPERALYNFLTIEFWGQEQIITCSDYFRFWDIKTGKHLRMLSPPPRYGVRRSNVTVDCRIALGNSCSEVVVWDIMCGKATQCFDLRLLRPDGVMILKVSLASSGILAICGKSWDQRFIAIGNAKDGSWIRRYSLPNEVPTLNISTPSLLDTDLGVLVYDMERGSSKKIPKVTAEDHWDPRCLRLSYSESEAWLMKGSRRLLWIPRQDVDLERFSVQTDLEAGKSTVTLVHDRCLFILTIDIDSI